MSQASPTVLQAVTGKNGGCGLVGRIRRFLLALALIVFAMPACAGDRLREVGAVAESGATQLALALIEAEQPAPEQAPEQWVLWEQLRIGLLGQLGDWERMAERLEQLPPALPDEFELWVVGERTTALLQLRRAREARALLSEAIWSRGADAPEALAAWRRQVIRSYLVEGRAEDAYTATLRYRNDYGEPDDEVRVLVARVMLMRNRPADAATLLDAVKGGQASALRLLAQLRAGLASPRQILNGAREAADAESRPRQRQIWWAVAAEAAQRAGDHAAQVLALEEVYRHLRDEPLDDALFHFSADLLWAAYLDYAQRVGNRKQMLIGDDASWFRLAETESRMYPVRTRSSYALLALNGRDQAGRERAHRALTRLLLDEPEGIEVLRRLYLDSKWFPSIQSVPATVRWELADKAVSRGDLVFASRLLAGLEQPPEGTDAVSWALRRARVMVLAGRPEDGAAILGRLAAQAGRLTPPEADRLMQVVFDLQTAGHHALVLPLFRRIYDEVPRQQFRRELLYWMADSHREQEQYRDAANLYLQSANLPGPRSMDQWARSARYQAAKALADAGFFRDARNVFQTLLEVEQDAGRQAVLQRDLDRVRLLEGKW